jgi:hypothetical protein
MDIGKSFTFMFDDKDWLKKLAIGGLLLLVSVIPPLGVFTAVVVMGYSLRVLKNVATGNTPTLPEWNDWGGDWVKGAAATVAALIYSLPAIVGSGVMGIVSAAVSDSGAGDLQGLALVCVMGCACLSVLWSIAVAVLYPAAQLQYVLEGRFGAFFNLRAIWGFIRANLGNYIMALLLTIVAGLISGFGIILCGIGLFFTSFWQMLVAPHLVGQVYAVAHPAAPAPFAGGQGYGDYSVPAAPAPDMTRDVTEPLSDKPASES